MTLTNKCLQFNKLSSYFSEVWAKYYRTAEKIRDGFQEKVTFNFEG